MKTFVLTILLSLVVAIVVIGRQRKEVVELRGQSETLHGEISKLGGEKVTESRKAVRSRSGISQEDGPRNLSKAVLSDDDVMELRAKLVGLLEGKNLASPRPREMVATYEAILQAVSHCRSADLLAVVENWEEAKNPSAKEGMLSMILQMLAMEQDPMRFLDKKSDGSPQDQEMMAAAVAALARQDAGQASEWLQEHGDTMAAFARDRVFASVAMKLLRDDMGAAIELFSGQPPRTRKKTLGMIAATGLTPLGELGTSARKVADDELRRDLLNSVVGAALTHNGIEAAEAQLKGIGDKEDQVAAVGHASLMALDSRPSEVMTWLLDGEVGSAKAGAVTETMTNWARLDFRAAAEWLGKRDPSSNRDAAIQGLTQAVRKLDPEGATKWATEISDPGLRSTAIQTELKHWKSVDEAAAQKWEDEQGAE